MQKIEQLLQARKRQPRRRANHHLLPVRIGHPYGQVGQRVIRLLDQIALASMDASAMYHQDFAPRTGVKAVADLYFRGVLMSSM